MRFNHTPTRYRIFDSKSQRPLLADGGDKQKNSDKVTPNKDSDDQDDDLKNVDQSKGGYGHGSGYDKEL